ncbi:MAG TPA: sugar phosphate isomerase/epimerase [Nitriliruptorales bacterium]|nr:sugar phosphate isomerase/epimerase [Nitriliruptorales bacterium]
MAPTPLLASTGPLFARPLDWAMGVIAEAGYDGVELMVTQDPATQDPERVLAAADREGVTVPIVHGPFLLLTRRVFGTDLTAKARRSLELASGLAAQLMIVHPPFRWQTVFHRWLLEEADAEAAELGTQVGVENLFPVPVLGRPVRFHRYTEPQHLNQFRHLVLDTSHFGVTEVDILEAWQRLGGAAAHLHVSDNRGNGRDSHAALGHGILPLAAFLGAVASSGYRGAITLELDCRRYLDDRAALVGYLRHERAKCRELLAGAPAEDVLGRPDRPPSTAPAVGLEQDAPIPLDV